MGSPIGPEGERRKRAPRSETRTRLFPDLPPLEERPAAPDEADAPPALTAPRPPPARPWPPWGRLRARAPGSPGSLPLERAIAGRSPPSAVTGACPNEGWRKPALLWQRRRAPHSPPPFAPHRSMGAADLPLPTSPEHAALEKNPYAAETCKMSVII